MKSSLANNFKTGLIALMVIAGSVSFSSSSNADSCWDHNGSIMRLEAEGNNRWFLYEKPKQVLRRAGVSRGTLLFNGRKQGDFYSGTARRFSKHCPGDALEYYVEGPVSRNPLKITVEGMREVQNRCKATGKEAWDSLVFTYLYKC